MKDYTRFIIQVIIFFNGRIYKNINKSTRLKNSLFGNWDEY